MVLPLSIQQQYQVENDKYHWKQILNADTDLRHFQERRVIACASVHTRAKVFRRVINRMRKLLPTRFSYIIACV